MGPEWWLKRAIENLYQGGFRGLDLGVLIPDLVVPAITSLGLALALPYVTAHGVAPAFISDEEILTAIQRRIYPSLLVIIVVVSIVVVQLKQCRKLYEHIKNDR